MNDKELQKLIDECQSEIAKKHRLGDKLVTGHKKSFFDESTILLIEKLMGNIWLRKSEIK